MERHDRQARLAEVGAAGQRAIAAATVDVETDGLAADVAACYLAGAGVGCVRVGDREVAAAAGSIDPAVRVESYRFPLEPSAREEIRALAIDTIVCCNVLEHIEGDEAALADMHSLLVPGGRLALLVPALQRIYGTLDEHLRHFRRYEKAELEGKVRAAGFTLEDCRFLNRPGVFGWWLNGRVLRRRVLPKGQLRAFRWIVPLLKREESSPPSYGMSLLAIARKS